MAQAFEFLVGRDRFELSTYGLRVRFLRAMGNSVEQRAPLTNRGLASII